MQSLRVLMVFLSASCLVMPSAAQAPTWQAVVASPAPFLAAWQTGAERLVLVGPETNQRQWEWDGLALRERSGAWDSQTNLVHLFCDPQRHELMALGAGAPPGHVVGTFQHGTWVWSTSAGGPAKTWNVVAAYDAARRRVVVVRTETGPTTVHEWDGQQWWLVANSGGPSNRTKAAFEYDPAQGRCVLYGGDAGGPLADCWAWDGFAWSQLAAAAPPGPRADAAMGFDPLVGALLLHGGSASTATWHLVGNQWQLLPTTVDAPAQSKHRLLRTPQGAVMVPGSIGRLGFAFQPLTPILRLQNGAWQPIAHYPEVTPRNNHCVAFDPVRANFVVFSGSPTSTFPMLDQTLVFDRFWRVPRPSTEPPRRFGARMAWSVANQRVLLFGGAGASSRFNDTWTWTGSTWEASTPLLSPPPREWHVLAPDSTGGVLLFGGADGAALLGDLWRWDGSNWAQLASPAMPAPRFGALADYDPDAGKVVLWGGNAGTTAFDDTWLWDGQQWSLTAASAGLNFRTMTFDPNRRRITMVGSTHVEWTGTAWQATGTTSTAGLWTRVAADTVHNRVYWFHPPEVQVLTTRRALSQIYGQGCSVAATPGLRAVGEPMLDGTMVCEVACSTPSALTFLILGLGQVTPPAPGCNQLVAQTIATQFAVGDAARRAQFPVGIPNTLALRGVAFTAQGAAYEPQWSPIGSVTLTQGLRLVLGD
jgi:hypothetical protein